MIGKGGYKLVKEKNIDPNLLLSQLMMFGSATQEMVKGRRIDTFAIFWPGAPCKKGGALRIFLETKCDNLLVANWDQLNLDDLTLGTISRHAPDKAELESKKISTQGQPSNIDGCIDYLLKNRKGKSMVVCATIDLLPIACLTLYKELYKRGISLQVIPVPIIVPMGTGPVDYEIEQLKGRPSLLELVVKNDTLKEIAEVLFWEAR